VILSAKANSFGATENLRDLKRDGSMLTRTDAGNRHAEREVRRLTLTLGLAVRERSDFAGV
jgi:hypothetical protein